MRRAAIFVATVLAATAADAKEVDWSGVWERDGGVPIEVKLEKGRYAVDAAVPVDGAERSVSFTGAAGGADLALEGTVAGAKGMARALVREKTEKRTRACQLVARHASDGDTETAAVAYRLDGAEVRKETWRRAAPLLEIVELRVDGRTLAGDFDAKRARLGLEVVYRVNGRASVPLTIRIEVDPSRHAYPSFYENPCLVEESLGTRSAGTHSYNWDGRDRTPAARIALGGSYQVSVRADDGRRATTFVTVGAPRFALVASAPLGKKDYLADAKERGLDLGQVAAGKGYAASLDTEALSAERAALALQEVATCVIYAHGTPGALLFRERGSAGPAGSLDSTNICCGAADLRDLHVAVVTACNSDRSPGQDIASIADSLVVVGGDVVIGFGSTVSNDEALVFQNAVLGLIERGATIEKAVRDAARASYRAVARPWIAAKTDEEIDRFFEKERQSADEMKSIGSSVAIRRGGGIPETESFWPPRYGNSKN